jgi:hypothetical protein
LLSFFLFRLFFGDSEFPSSKACPEPAGKRCGEMEVDLCFFYLLSARLRIEAFAIRET